LNLKAQAVNGVKWTSLSAIISTILQFLQLAILARFIEPSAFGLMALVMVVIGFSQAFLDMGLSNAIIHKQTISQTQLSTLYWVNNITGIILFILICALAPVIARFYNEPELTKLISIVATTFIILPLGQQFMTLWQKKMRFDDIAKITISTKLISLVVSVYFAYLGHGVYALVYGTVTSSVVQTIQYLRKGLKEYKPSFVFNLKEINEFLWFGAYQMGDRTLNYFSFQIDTIIIGKILGVEALGIYTIAKQIIMRPSQIINPIITKVTFPTMSIIQEDVKKLKTIYLKTINYLASINFPIYAGIAVFSQEIVSIMFGEKYLEAIIIVQILAIWGAIRSTGNPVGSLLLAKGKANWGFWWNLCLFFYYPIGIFFGSHWGIEGVSWALVSLSIPTMIANWKFLVKPLCEAHFIEYHKQIFTPFVISLFIGGGTFISIHFIEHTVIRIVIGSLTGLSIAFGMNYFMNKSFVNEMQSFRNKKR
jgi:O-antigen/teichoic acid export membrane protein